MILSLRNFQWCPLMWTHCTSFRHFSFRFITLFLTFLTLNSALRLNCKYLSSSYRSVSNARFHLISAILQTDTTKQKILMLTKGFGFKILSFEFAKRRHTLVNYIYENGSGSLISSRCSASPLILNAILITIHKLISRKCVCFMCV